MTDDATDDDLIADDLADDDDKPNPAPLLAPGTHVKPVRKSEIVDISEHLEGDAQGSVQVVELTVAEYRNVEKRVKGADDKVDELKLSRLLMECCVRYGDGSRFFTKNGNNVDTLGVGMLRCLDKAVGRINGFTKQTIEDAEKNSETTRPATL